MTYYGYRYYDPITGRWPSRDPITERGGLNLYAFNNNNSLCNIDLLGKQMKTYNPGSAIPKPVDNWDHDIILKQMAIQLGAKPGGQSLPKWPLRHHVITCEGCVLKIKDAELKVDIEILKEYYTGDKKDERRDKSNLTTLEHERKHEHHHEVSWNAAAVLINPNHDRDFKTESCCWKWQEYLKELYSMFEYLAVLKDELFDCDEYGRCDGVQRATNDLHTSAAKIKYPDCNEN